MSTYLFTQVGIQQKAMFPSPCGEDVMSTTVVQSKVSSMKGLVSIPLRGRCNVNLTFLNMMNRLSEFPSPCGEDVMSTWHEDSIQFFLKDVSIPLRGRCNVNALYAAFDFDNGQMVSIPLRGRCNVN